MEQNQFTPEGFVSLMRDHARELAASATSLSPGITFDQLAQMGIDIQQRSGDPYAEDGYALIKKEKGTGAKEDVSVESQAKKSFGSYEPDKYEYGYENGKFYRDKK